jgi:predicted ribosome quality control (RQC) complex YloA/Tae2 family protein
MVEARMFRTYVVDGIEVLVGRGARENDRLSLRVGRPRDHWLHAAGCAGSHVVVRVPDDGREVPRDVLLAAAELAAWHSKAREVRGKVPVHACRVEDVSKPRGAPPGQVRLRRFETLRVYPRDIESSERGEGS